MPLLDWRREQHAFVHVVDDHGVAHAHVGLNAVTRNLEEDDTKAPHVLRSNVRTH